MHHIDKVHKSKRHTQAGFTLVELIVSVGIFAVVITISVSTLLVMIDANRKAQGLQTAMTNLSFVMDSITRNVRTGYNYYCRTSSISSLPSSSVTQDCTDGSNIVFTSERTGERIGYRLNNSAIQRQTGNGGWLTVTGDDVSIDTFSATVENTDGYYSDGNVAQPKVILHVTGTVFEGLEAETRFDLQTEVIQRTLDY